MWTSKFHFYSTGIYSPSTFFSQQITVTRLYTFLRPFGCVYTVTNYMNRTSMQPVWTGSCSHGSRLHHLEQMATSTELQHSDETIITFLSISSKCLEHVNDCVKACWSCIFRTRCWGCTLQLRHVPILKCAAFSLWYRCYQDGRKPPYQANEQIWQGPCPHWLSELNQPVNCTLLYPQKPNQNNP